MRPASLIALLSLPLLLEIAAAPLGPGLRRQAQQLAAMTAAQFEASATVKDDALETEATITTENGWQAHEGLLGVVNEDSFFRVFVDKKTGVARYQVYNRLHYIDRRRATFEAVNYESPAGPISATLTPIFRTRNDCRNSAGCPFDEVFGFEVDEALLRKLGAKYRPGQVAIWKYRIKAHSGAERDEFFVAAEIAGALAAVDHYRAAHGLPGAPTIEYFRPSPLGEGTGVGDASQRPARVTAPPQPLP